MANAQAAQDELQQSVILSEEDAEYEEDDAPDAMDIDGTSAGQPATKIKEETLERASEAPILPEQEGESGHGKNEYIDNNDQIDADKVPEGGLGYVDEDQDTEGKPDENEDCHHAHDGRQNHNESNHDENAVFDEDADGEDDDMLQPEENGVLSGEEEEDEDEEEEAEGVGAVKFKPGETDEDESEVEDDASFASGGGGKGECPNDRLQSLHKF